MNPFTNTVCPVCTSVWTHGGQQKHDPETVLLGWVEALLMYLFREISSFGVASGDGCMVPQQQVMHWCPHNLTAANHHGFLPSDRHAYQGEISPLINSDLIHF